MDEYTTITKPSAIKKNFFAPTKNTYISNSNSVSPVNVKSSDDYKNPNISNTQNNSNDTNTLNLTKNHL